MTKETIAVDVDEVLYPFLDEFIVHHDHNYGTKLNKEQFTAYDFDGPLDLPTSETVRRIYNFLELSGDLEVEPIEEARDSIAKLSERFNLVIVTARHSSFENITQNWLGKHFPNYFQDVELIGYAPIMDKPLTKAEVCIKLGAIALIDDSLLHVKQATSAGINGILFGDYPWNKTEKLPHGVIRCDNWPKVLKYLLN